MNITKQLSFIFLIVLLLYTCSTDYDIGKSTIVEQDCLVVNSLLNPADPIRICFYTTFGTDSGYRFANAKGVSVLLKENDAVLFNGICEDFILSLNHYPKVGATYAIEASLAGYDRIEAKTHIPEPIQCKAEMKILGEVKYSVFDLLISLSEFNFPKDEQVGLLITSCVFYEHDTLQYNDLYVNNMLVDRINREEGMEVKNESVGSVYYNAFLRVKSANLPHLDEIIFTPSNLPYSVEHDHNVWPEQVNVKLITASKEYDQYCRSLYEQKAMIIYDDDISSIVFQPIRVFSNIESGLGIFAGMNEMNYLFDYPEQPDFNLPEW